MALVLSIVALLAGPFLYGAGRDHPHARQLLDGFIFITVAGIVGVHIIPEALEVGGTWALGFLLLGLAFPVLLEKSFERALHGAHDFILLLAALGLATHAVVDGIALLQPDSQPGSSGPGPLAWGVILHRLPIGMAIWWSLRPHFSAAVAIGTYALIVLATSASYLLGDPIIQLVQTQPLAYFQAFVAGSLVHVVAFGVSHSHDGHVEPAPAGPAPGGSAARGDWGYRLGILVGLFVLFAAPHIGGQG